jgi:N-methylhydantoinase B
MNSASAALRMRSRVSAWVLLAGCLLGRDLTAALVGKYGIATFEHAVDIILDQSEEAARALIRSMPDGTYTHETFLDNDRAGSEPLPI